MRVAIAEDSGFFRAALAGAIEAAGIEVTAAVSTPDDLVSAIAADPPDAVVLDICLPPTKTDEGLVLAERLAESHPNVGVLVLSAYLATPHVSRLLHGRSTGVGCLSKDQLHDGDVLLDAITRVANGGTFVDPEFVDHRFRQETLRSVLTGRELELLRAVAQGHSNQGIAQRHHIGIKTVESTLTSVFRKLDLDSKEGNARVMAVLAFLSRPQASSVQTEQW